MGWGFKRARFLKSENVFAFTFGETKTISE